MLLFTNILFLSYFKDDSYKLSQLVGKNQSNNTVNSQNSCVEGFRERNVLFNDALNTFYLRLYGVRHIYG